MQGGEGAGPSGGAAAAEPTPQSPWEMFALGVDADAARLEAPVLADEVAARVLGAVERLAADGRYRLLVATPQPGDRYPADASGARPLLSGCRGRVPLAMLSRVVSRVRHEVVQCWPLTISTVQQGSCLGLGLGFPACSHEQT